MNYGDDDELDHRVYLSHNVWRHLRRAVDVRVVLEAHEQHRVDP